MVSGLFTPEVFLDDVTVNVNATSVPGPIDGAGLPGLVLAGGGWRRKIARSAIFRPTCVSCDGSHACAFERAAPFVDQRAKCVLLRLDPQRQLSPRADMMPYRLLSEFVPKGDICSAANIVHLVWAAYSITSSARTSSIGGTSSPSALAVAMLITSSNLVGWSTGRSAGFAPLSMRPT